MTPLQTGCCGFEPPPYHLESPFFKNPNQWRFRIENYPNSAKIGDPAFRRCHWNVFQCRGDSRRSFDGQCLQLNQRHDFGAQTACKTGPGHLNSCSAFLNGNRPAGKAADVLLLTSENCFPRLSPADYRLQWSAYIAFFIGSLGSAVSSDQILCLTRRCQFSISYFIK